MSENENLINETPAERSKRLLLEKSRKELVDKTKEAFKVFAPMSTFMGFVGDIIKPLAPILHWISGFFFGTTIILLVMLVVDRKRGTTRKLTQYLPHSVILAIILMIFSAAGFGHKDGFFGTNFELVHQFQVSVLKVDPAKEEPDDSPEDDLANLTDNSQSATDITVIDQHLGDIRELISMQKLQDNPEEPRDYVVNAAVYYNVGNFTKAEEMFQKLFAGGYLKLDLCTQYYEVLFANLDGDELAINRRLDSLKLSSNEMMRIAAIDFHFNGVSYYRELERAVITDTLLKAVAENMSAKSLITDSHNFSLYQPYLVARWNPVWRKNDQLLGKNIIKAKRLFFNYPEAYRKYLEGTVDERHENLAWRTDIHYEANETEVIRQSMMLWNRIASGIAPNVQARNNYLLEGTVTDDAGNPLQDVVVADFDTFTDGTVQYNLTLTDSAGRYSITTGPNHLIRFEHKFDKSEYFDAFIVTSQGKAAVKRIVLQRKTL